MRNPPEPEPGEGPGYYIAVALGAFAAVMIWLSTRIG